MNKLSISAITIAVGFALSGGVWAANMSKSEYKSEEKSIASTYKTDKDNCKPMKGNAKDVCMKEAKGKENVAKAELETRYKPSDKARYKARVAKADADYAVAKEKCDDQKGNAKDVCVKEAKAAYTTAKADAKTNKTVAEANKDANQTSTKAREKANEKVAGVRRDANEDKRDAEYAVAKEKCDSLTGSAKDRCITDAKARYNK